MTALEKWIDRRFEFTAPVAWCPEVIERLRGTPARVVERLAGLSPEALVTRPADGSWSLIEHVGHLADLDEHLFSGRLDDFEAQQDTLRAADMSNRLTHEAQHHTKRPDEVIARFRGTRDAIVRRLEGYPVEMFGRVAGHPRLNTPMRLLDSMLFQAEHDDYHLARMSELLRSRSPA